MRKGWLLIFAVMSIFTQVAGTVFSAQGDQWSERIEVEYRMGDEDSRSMARERARDQLIEEAAAKLGYYVQGTETLNDGELSRKIEALSAAMISVNDPSDKLVVREGGSPVLIYSAEASVDTSVLSKRIEALQKDQALARDFEDLQAQVTALETELAQARRNQGTAQRIDFLKREASLVKAINGRREAVTGLFSKGRLIDMAEATDNTVLTHKLAIIEGLFGYAANMPINASVETVARLDSGLYKVFVRVDWPDFPKSAVAPLNAVLEGKEWSPVQGLGRDLKTPSHWRYSGYHNLKSVTDGADASTAGIFRWLLKGKASAAVTIGGKTKELPILGLWHDPSHVSRAADCHPTSEKGEWGSHSERSEIRDTFCVNHGESTDEATRMLEFVLTEQEAQSADSVTAEMTIEYPPLSG